jgi:hypothetical protein
MLEASGALMACVNLIFLISVSHCLSFFCASVSRGRNLATWQHATTSVAQYEV